jgi:aminomethyltransferase
MEKACRTQLYEAHKRTARIVVFAGFEMPLYFKDIAPEHLAVRNSVGMFDISHMGRIVITGVDSERFLNHVITNDLSVLAPNSAQYSVMCNEKGGIIDDFVIYRLEKEKFMLVSNASNREKDYNWLVRNAKGFNVKLEEVSDNVAMLSVQGPNAEKTLQKICIEDLSKIERFKCSSASLAGIQVFVSRTGYTGEDGFEIFVWNAPLTKPDNAIKLWNTILEAGKAYAIEPCGLGARDTVRLEAGLCLYGNDIDENTTPLEAKLGFVVKLQKSEFIAKAVLTKQKAEGVKKQRVGIRMTEQGIPRQGFKIFNDKNEEIGCVTSGTFSPLLKCGVAMAYVRTEDAKEGNIVKLKIRNKLVEEKIANFPLYDPAKYGYKRQIQTST